MSELEKKLTEAILAVRDARSAVLAVSGEYDHEARQALDNGERVDGAVHALHEGEMHSYATVLSALGSKLRHLRKEARQ